MHDSDSGIGIDSGISPIFAGIGIGIRDFKTYWKLGLILKLRRFSVGLASPRVPTSPRKAILRVQTDELVPALPVSYSSFTIFAEWFLANIFTTRCHNLMGLSPLDIESKL